MAASEHDIKTAASVNRFKRDNPCPICGGWDSIKRGLGKRCYGFLSQDGLYAHCTREELAGGIPKHQKSGGYPHVLQGLCDCGQRHDTVGRKVVMKLVKKYRYRDAKGRVLYEVVRYKPKAFRQRRRVDDKWVWNLDGVPRVLYRLPELSKAKPGRTVYVAEGERDSDSLAKLGLVTTTNPGGAGKWKPEDSEFLTGRKVVILPDNDDVGRDHANQVAQSLGGLAKNVKIVDLPNLPPHGDVTDWIAAGGTRKQLRALVREARKFVSAKAVRRGLPFRTVKQMSALKYKPLIWIVYGLVAAGAITNLVGKVKASGKTTLLTFMVAALLRGQKFMDLKTTRTSVVYLTEQPWSSFREALRRAGLLAAADLVMLQWSDTMGKPWEEIAHAAIKECETRGAELLIVDTFPPFAGLAGATENDAGHVLEAMKPLQAAAEKSGIAVIIVQHERKGGGEVGEAGRGSTAFPGAADIVLTLSRRRGKGQENFREIVALSRFSETPSSLLIELTGQGYVSHGPIRAIAVEEATDFILEVAPSSKGKAMTMQELMKASGLGRTTLQRAIKTPNVESPDRPAWCGKHGRATNPRWGYRNTVQHSCSRMNTPLPT